VTSSSCCASAWAPPSGRRSAWSASTAVRSPDADARPGGLRRGESSCSPAPTGGRPSTAAPTSTPCAWPPRPRPVSASSAAARSSRRRVGPRCGHARRARPRAARRLRVLPSLAARAAPGQQQCAGVGGVADELGTLRLNFVSTGIDCARRGSLTAASTTRSRSSSHSRSVLESQGEIARLAAAGRPWIDNDRGRRARQRPATARLRPSSSGAAHRVRPGRCCSARARAGSSPDRARPPDARSCFARADRAFPGGLLVNGATARAANTHAARGPALPPPSS
jgi:hypothetical protein